MREAGTARASAGRSNPNYSIRSLVAESLAGRAKQFLGHISRELELKKNRPPTLLRSCSHAQAALALHQPSRRLARTQVSKNVHCPACSRARQLINTCTSGRLERSADSAPRNELATCIAAIDREMQRCIEYIEAELA